VYGHQHKARVRRAVLLLLLLPADSSLRTQPTAVLAVSRSPSQPHLQPSRTADLGRVPTTPRLAVMLVLETYDAVSAVTVTGMVWEESSRRLPEASCKKKIAGAGAGRRGVAAELAL
jgi:hypothetical protein